MIIINFFNLDIERLEQLTMFEYHTLLRSTTLVIMGLLVDREVRDAIAIQDGLGHTALPVS